MTPPGESRAAVLGSPVAHSLSPAMHAAAYGQLGLDWRYERHECSEEQLAPFVAALDDRWRGLSLTMPLKEVAFDVAVEVDPVAQDVGAINTLVRSAAGWTGHNTDVAGIRAALGGIGATAPERVLVLGSGATTRSTLRAVADLGASAVTFAVRSQVRQNTLDYAHRLSLATDVVPLAAVPDVVAAVDLVVDTLPGGAADPVAASLAGVQQLPALFEVIYEGWPTALARTFDAAGAPVASGLVMLAHQGAEQVRLMTGLDLDEAQRQVLAGTMLDAALEALAAGR